MQDGACFTVGQRAPRIGTGSREAVQSTWLAARQPLLRLRCSRGRAGWTAPAARQRTECPRAAGLPTREETGACPTPRAGASRPGRSTPAPAPTPPPAPARCRSTRPQLPVPRQPARRRPVRAGRARQHLHADHEPDAGRARAARRVAGGRGGRAGGSSRPGRARPSRSSTSPRPATTSSPRPRCTAAPTTCCTTRCPSSASPSPSSRTPTTRRTGVAGPGQHQGVLRARRSATRRATSSTSRRVAGVAHSNGVPLIVDNTIATPYLIRPFEYGADIVVHSATKYLGGHGTAIAGVIVDGGTFDWAQRQVPGLHHPGPDATTASSTPTSVAPAYALKARVQLLRDLGPAISPFNAFLVVAGHRDAVAAHRAARRQRPAGGGVPRGPRRGGVGELRRAGVVARGTRAQQKYAPQGRRRGARVRASSGGTEAGQTFVEALELHSHVANIGDVRSLVIHPASTTHSQLTAEEQLTTGVTPGLVRLAVGLEGDRGHPRRPRGRVPRRQGRLRP